MADNKQDDKGAQKPKTPQTPFGGWASAPPKHSAEGGPRPVVTNEDGSQRPAGEADVSAPPPNIKSFSDTFGAVAKEIPALPDIDDLGEPVLPPPGPAAESQQDETGDEGDEQAEDLPPAPPEPDDPFAWKPEDTPAAGQEPRRSGGGGEGWMQANTSYEELQMSTRAALQEAERDKSGDVIETEITPTVNPYTFNKEEGWVAPPMDLHSLEEAPDAETPPITEEEKPSFEFTAPEPVAAEPDEDDTQTASPFDFTAYAEEDDAGQGDATIPTAPQEAPEAAATPDLEEPSPPAPEPAETPSFATPVTEDAPSASEQPATTARTNFQAYKSAPVSEQDSAIPEEFILQPEEASLLGEPVPASPVTAEKEPASVPTLPGSPAPQSWEQPAEIPSPPDAADVSAQDSAPAPTDGALSADAALPQDVVSDTLPEDAFVTPPADRQDMPLPETYTPPAAEESPLPEQTATAWEPQAQADAPALPEPQASQPWEQPAETPSFPAPGTEGAFAQHIPTVEAPAPFAPVGEPAQDTGHDFGGGGSDSPEGLMAVAQADSTPFQTAEHDAPHHPEPVTYAPVANSHSVEEIQAILQSHALWLNSGGKDGRRANFRNAVLQQCDLSGSQLAEASFRGANLTGCTLSGSDLRGVDMSEAQLSGANLASASMTGAIFSRTDLRNAVFDGADLQSVDFSGSILPGAVLAGLNLSGAVLLDADLQGADLSHASLIGVNMRGANLSYANLSAANLSNANCRDVQFQQAVLDGAAFEGANLKNAGFQGASLLGTDLSSAGEASPEQRQDTIHAEKEQLLQEWQRLKEHEAQVLHLQSSIQQREMALQTERVNTERARREIQAQYESMEKVIAKTHEVMARHRIHDRLFKYFGVTWFIFTILVAVSIIMFLSALEMNLLDWLERSIVIGGCALIMGLFIATTVRSIKLSNNLKQLLDMYGQHMSSSDKSGH